MTLIVSPDQDEDPAARVELRRLARERAFPRWELRVAVDLESENCLYAGLSYDVSAGGIFVATGMTPPIGAAVRVHVTLPDGTWIDQLGIVRWVREPQQASAGLPSGCGLEWVALDDESLRTLLRFAEMRDPLLWEPIEEAA